ncbi:hypothetical protein [Pleionea sediminis]|uniref:hypothetical protein n=1 Tax=Pleionea sediminis TaxID=2569479 RepID=UPI0011851EB1|nr:hypothetical protein [Pleionea sediminis]
MPSHGFTQEILEYSADLIRQDIPSLSLKLRNEAQSGNIQTENTIFENQPLSHDDVSNIITLIAKKGREFLENEEELNDVDYIERSALSAWLDYAKTLLAS